MSLIGRLCCKSRFALMIKNSAGYRRGFRVKMRGTSSPHVKLTGDFGNAIEVIRIGDCFPSRVFAKNSQTCNFRLLQHNRPKADTAPSLQAALRSAILRIEFPFMAAFQRTIASMGTIQLKFLTYPDFWLE